MREPIRSLTERQEVMLPVWRDRWSNIRSCCEPADLAGAKQAVRCVYESVGLQPPKVFLLVDGPLSCALASAYLKHAGHSLGRSVLGTIIGVLGAIHNRILKQFDEAVWFRVVNEVQGYNRTMWFRVLEEVIGEKVHQCGQGGDVKYSLIRLLPRLVQAASIKRARWSNEELEALLNQLRPQLARSMEDQLAGHFLAHYLAIFSYCIEVLGIDKSELLRNLMELAGCCGWWAPYENMAILQHRPRELRFNDALRLHCGHGPAVTFRDGITIWALNGVLVPQWLVEKKDTDIDPRLLLRIYNADIRREFIRKVGIDRICYALNAKCVDRQGAYELLMLTLPGSDARYPYLKMLNPSIGTWHVEGVHPDCNTVAKALAWRNQISEPPAELS